MDYLTVKNWFEFQHYKDRNPPWIKLHRALLDDYEFSCLQDASKVHLVLIWLLASQSDGRIPNDPKFLQHKLSLKSPPDLQALITTGFLIVEQYASNLLAASASDLRLETEAYKASETDTPPKPGRKQLPAKAPVPDDWQPTQRTAEKLAAQYRFTNGDAERYLEAFKDQCKAKGYEYRDFDAAFRNCVRADWPKFRNGLRTMPKNQDPQRPDY